METRHTWFEYMKTNKLYIKGNFTLSPCQVTGSYSRDMQVPLGLGVSAVGSVGPGRALSPGKVSEALVSPQGPRFPRQGEGSRCLQGA